MFFRHQKDKPITSRRLYFCALRISTNKLTNIGGILSASEGLYRGNGSTSLTTSDKNRPVETERQMSAYADKATVQCTEQSVRTCVRQVGLLSTAGVDS